MDGIVRLPTNCRSTPLNKPVVQSIRERAEAHPDRAALVRGAQRVTYGELWTAIVSGAAHLAGRGVRPGDRVIIAAPSTPAFVFAYFATHLLGAVAVPVDPNAHASRRDELIERTRASVAFGAKGEESELLARIHSIDEFAQLPKIADAPAFPALGLDADLLFTTGSTGRPKGVRLTHENIAVSGAHINAVIRTPEGAAEVVPLPLYHAFGLGRLRCDLIAGRSVILVYGFRLPGEIFAAIEKHNAAGLVGVPSGFAVLLGFGKRGLGRYADQLRYIEIGSSPMPPAHKQELMELLPKTDLWMHYGLTEAARSVFIEFHRHRDRLHAVGLPAPGVEISIRGADGSVQGPGQPGMLWIGGRHISPGYWDDAELTEATFSDGRARTGDVACLDDKGFIVLQGRSDDMVKVGGFNVSPDEVERALSEHPAVNEAACVGVPDPNQVTGQVVCAFIVAADSQKLGENSDVPTELATALSQWVGAKLEPYKVPKVYRLVKTLPRTESGKLLRRVLRDSLA